MRNRSHSLLLCALGAAGLAMTGSQALAAGTFTVSASNVTMPHSGAVTSSYTVTAVPLTGTLVLNCVYSGPTTTAKIPICNHGPAQSKPVTSGDTVTGEITFYPWGVPVPANHRREPARTAALGLALAGGLLMGFGLRRRARRWIAPALLAGAALAGAAALSGCSSANSMTPGTYTYTVSAVNNAGGPAVLTIMAKTTITATVP